MSGANPRVGECAACHFVTEVADYTDGVLRESTVPLCALCAATATGRLPWFPSNYSTVLRTVCYVGNAVLTELRKRGNVDAYVKDACAQCGHLRAEHRMGECMHATPDGSDLCQCLAFVEREE